MFISCNTLDIVVLVNNNQIKEMLNKQEEIERNGV